MIRAVLDENVARRLATLISDGTTSVHAFPNAWKGQKNGALLRLVVASGYGVLITGDKSMRHQQSLGVLPLTLLVLPTLDIKQLTIHIHDIRLGLRAARPGFVSVLTYPPT
jgi:hypothetical protein